MLDGGRINSGKPYTRQDLDQFLEENPDIREDLAAPESLSKSMRIAAVIRALLISSLQKLEGNESMPDGEFVRPQQVSLDLIMPSVSRLFIIGEESRQKKVKEKETKKDEIKDLIIFIAKSLGVNFDADMNAMLNVGPLTEQLFGLKRPRSRDIKEVLYRSPLFWDKQSKVSAAFAAVINDDEDFKTKNPVLYENVEKLRNKLARSEGMRVAFLNMMQYTQDSTGLSLDPLYRQRIDGFGKETQFSKSSVALIAIQANQMAKDFFGNEFGFVDEVEDCLDFGVMNLLTRRRPVDEQSYRVWKDACLKLELMHKIYRAVSRIDFKRARSVADNLRWELTERRLFVDREGNAILNPAVDPDGNLLENSDNEDVILVARVEVSPPKEFDAVIRKTIARNRSISDIKDVYRARVLMRPQDCFDVVDGQLIFNEEKFKKAAKKVMAFFFQILGTDYNEKEVDFHFDTANEFSTNEFKNISVIFEGQIFDLEVQIDSFMTEDELRKDHEVYIANQIVEFRHLMGADMDFSDFAMQLVELTNTRHDLQYDHEYSQRPLMDRAEVASHLKSAEGKTIPPEKGDIGKPVKFLREDQTKQLHPKPFVRKRNLRAKALLLSILTRRGADGNLVNKTTLDAILADPDKKSELMKALKALRDEPAYDFHQFGPREHDLSFSIKQKALDLERMIQAEDFSTPKRSYTVNFKHSGTGRGDRYVWKKEAHVSRKSTPEVHNPQRFYFGDVCLVEGREGDRNEKFFHVVETRPTFAFEDNKRKVPTGTKYEVDQNRQFIIRGSGAKRHIVALTKVITDNGEGEIIHSWEESLLCDLAPNGAGPKGQVSYNVRYHDPADGIISIPDCRTTGLTVEHLRIALSLRRKWEMEQKVAFRSASGKRTERTKADFDGKEDLYQQVASIVRTNKKARTDLVKSAPRGIGDVADDCIHHL